MAGKASAAQADFLEGLARDLTDEQFGDLIRQKDAYQSSAWAGKTTRRAQIRSLSKETVSKMIAALKEDGGQVESLTIKPYVMKDGRTMVFIESSFGGSVGLGFTARVLNPDQQAILAKASKVMAAQGEAFTGDLADHTEESVRQLTNGWHITGTEVATIGGMKVDADGVYLIDAEAKRIIWCYTGLSYQVEG